MNKKIFNIIYEDDNLIIPEIDDNELLEFSIAFMNIQKRELKSGKEYNKKNKDKK